MKLPLLDTEHLTEFSFFILLEIKLVSAFSLLGCYAGYVCRCLPTFRKGLSILSVRNKKV
jgi:hypothetical protein